MDKTYYNKTISMKPIEHLKENEKQDFDLCFYVYQGKLTSIVEVFNHQTIQKSIKIVKESIADKNRNPLQIACISEFFKYFFIFINF